MIVLSIVYVNFFSEESWLDREVKRLCAIDGGIKVYETVKLLAEKFTKGEFILIPYRKTAKLSDKYSLDY